MTHAEKLGHMNYAAYCRVVGTTFDGKPLPTWDVVPGSGAPVLTPKIRDGWIAGAQAVATEHSPNLEG